MPGDSDSCTTQAPSCVCSTTGRTIDRVAIRVLIAHDSREVARDDHVAQQRHGAIAGVWSHHACAVIVRGRERDRRSIHSGVDEHVLRRWHRDARS